MKFSLDWEEGVFLGLRHLWRKLTPTSPVPWDGDRATVLGPNLARFTHFAQIMAGRPLVVRESEGNGGIRGAVLLLPPAIDLAPEPETNLEIYLLRTAIAANMIHQGHHQRCRPTELENRLTTLFAARDAARRLSCEWDRFAERYVAAVELEVAARPRAETLVGADRELEAARLLLLRNEESVTYEDLVHRLDHLKGKTFISPGLILWGECLSSADEETAKLAEKELIPRERPGDGTEIQAPARDVVQRTFLEKEEEVEPVPLHTFEKVETLDTYKGGQRQVDGEDELADHEEALNELDLREVIRGGRDTQGFYKAELDVPGNIPDVHRTEPGERGIPFPEWHCRSRTYREGWVAVYPSRVRARDEGWAGEVVRSRQRLIRNLHQCLLNHHTKELRRNRQPYGNEIDLDALVEAYALRKAGHDPGELFYEHHKKLLRDTATVVLMDISLSSGSWVEGKRVLDITREAVVILGEVADKLGDQLEILCFASNTRNLCRVWTIKSWHETWAEGRARLGPLQPQGYTRIGPALRYATGNLKEVDARHKLLLLLTDGKPTDYDRYEGRYGIEDVKMAVREALRDGITIHALALDPAARAMLPVMFGTGGWELIRHLADLPGAMTKAYGRLTA